MKAKKKAGKTMARTVFIYRAQCHMQVLVEPGCRMDGMWERFGSEPGTDRSYPQVPTVPTFGLGDLGGLVSEGHLLFIPLVLHGDTEIRGIQ